MRYVLRHHPAVLSDLQAIFDMLDAHAGRRVAQDKLSQIEAALRALRDLPHKGTLRHEIAPGLRAIPAAERAVIAFTIEDRAVYVHAITYGGADWQGRVRRRL